eukprot:scaffold34019_cov60-Attheya_sp.AAC.1
MPLQVSLPKVNGVESLKVASSDMTPGALFFWLQWENTLLGSRALKSIFKTDHKENLLLCAFLSIYDFELWELKVFCLLEKVVDMMIVERL